jgi:lysophospholipase L1-like esterase
MSANQRMVLRAVVSLLAYVTACVAFVALRGQSLFLSVLAIFGVGLLAVRLHRILRKQVEDFVVAPWKRWALVGLVVAVGLVLVAVWLFGHVDGAGFFGVALLYLGLGLAVGELRSWHRYPRRAFALALAGSVGLTVAGLGAAAVGIESAWWLVVLGVATAPIGIALVSEIALRRMRSWRPTWSLAWGGAGLVLMAIGLVLIWARGVNEVYLTVAAGLLVLVMVGIAARSNIDVVFVVAAAAVVWTLGQRSVPEPESLHPQPDDKIVVALGDSYISGEGADQYYEGTNTPGQSTCRRAPTAYPPLLILERRAAVPDRLAFLACSGAKIHQVVRPDGAGTTQVAKLLDQIGPADEDIEFVLVSMGGNDALFGAVGQACLLPIDCTDLAPAFRDNLASVGERLDAAYADLRDQLPGVPVLVVPYPVPVYPERCDESVFSPAEHRFLHDFSQQLNDTVAASAGRAGFHVVDTMPRALDGLQLCDPDAEDVGVNFLAANSVLGTVEQSLNPTNWVHNSLHPNSRGHEAMRSALVTWLDRHPNIGPPGPPQAARPQAAPAIERGSSPCLGQRRAALDACAQDWAAQKAARYLLRSGWLVVPALLGAWLVALQLVRLWWSIFGEPTISPGKQPDAGVSEPAVPAADRHAVGASR